MRTTQRRSSNSESSVGPVPELEAELELVGLIEAVSGAESDMFNSIIMLSFNMIQRVMLALDVMFVVSLGNKDDKRPTWVN